MSSPPNIANPASHLAGSHSSVAFEDHPVFNEWLRRWIGREIVVIGEYEYDAAETMYKMNRDAYANLLTQFQAAAVPDDLLLVPTSSPADVWLNESHGMVRLGEFCYDAADVLRQVDNLAYDTECEKFQSNEDGGDLITTSDYQKLKDKVCVYYPPLIAYNLHRVFNSENYKARLERLRDVWESVVYWLYALIIAEYRSRSLNLRPAGITFAQLFNEGIDHRIQTIKKLLDYATAQGITLRCHSLIPSVVLDDIVSLNRIRNQFSHNSSLAESQAQDRFDNNVPKVREILLNLSGLEQKSLLRYIGAPSGILRPEFEKFLGFDLQPQTYAVQLEAAQLAEWSHSLRGRIVLAVIEKDLWNLSPFIHLNLRSGRHTPDIWVFKKKRNQLRLSSLNSCQLLFEDVASSEEKYLTGEDFRAEIREIHSLCQ